MTFCLLTRHYFGRNSLFYDTSRTDGTWFFKTTFCYWLNILTFDTTRCLLTRFSTLYLLTRYHTLPFSIVLSEDTTHCPLFFTTQRLLPTDSSPSLLTRNFIYWHELLSVDLLLLLYLLTRHYAVHDILSMTRHNHDILFLVSSLCLLTRHIVGKHGNSLSINTTFCLFISRASWQWDDESPASCCGPRRRSSHSRNGACPLGGGHRAFLQPMGKNSHARTLPTKIHSATPT